MNPPSVFQLPGAGPVRAVADAHQETVPHADSDDVAGLPAVNIAAKRAADVGSQAAIKHGAFLPVVLMTLALSGWFSAQLWDAYQQRLSLLAAHAVQQQTVDNAGKLRQSLDALAADTQRMADGGNANAALLVTELRARGITISLPGAASTAPATAPAMPR